jgi:SAM-dependent methyltransferase
MITRDDYNAWAATYDVVDNPLVAVSTFAVDDAVWSGARVLELGCGTARNAAAILEAGAREYVGIDASSEMLARGRARLADEPRVRLIEGDVAAALRDGFDVVVFCLVLEHFETLAAPLAAAAAALRPGGELRIFELHPTWWHEGARAHYVVDGQERALASWPHDEPEFAAALPAHDLDLVTARSWYSHEAACTRSPKLRKRLGRPVLLEIAARRRV